MGEGEQQRDAVGACCAAVVVARVFGVFVIVHALTISSCLCYMCVCGAQSTQPPKEEAAEEGGDSDGDSSAGEEEFLPMPKSAQDKAREKERKEQVGACIA